MIRERRAVVHTIVLPELYLNVSLDRFFFVTLSFVIVIATPRILFYSAKQFQTPKDFNVPIRLHNARNALELWGSQGVHEGKRVHETLKKYYQKAKCKYGKFEPKQTGEE